MQVLKIAQFVSLDECWAKCVTKGKLCKTATRQRQVEALGTSCHQHSPGGACKLPRPGLHRGLQVGSASAFAGTNSTGDSNVQPGLNDSELTNKNGVGIKVHVCNQRKGISIS